MLLISFCSQVKIRVVGNWLEAEAKSAGMETASGGMLHYFEAVYLLSSCISWRKNKTFLCGQIFCLFCLSFVLPSLLEHLEALIQVMLGFSSGCDCPWLSHLIGNVVGPESLKRYKGHSCMTFLAACLARKSVILREILLISHELCKFRGV